MREKMILRWNNVVSQDDIVYVLGDFSLTSDKEKITMLVSRLNGRKVLVMGNHDTKKPQWYLDCGFIQATRKPILYQYNVVLMHEPPETSEIINGMHYFFGHVHDKHCDADDYINCKCVSAERIDYTPIDLDKAIKTMLGTHN